MEPVFRPDFPHETAELEETHRWFRDVGGDQEHEPLVVLGPKRVRIPTISPSERSPGRIELLPAERPQRAELRAAAEGQEAQQQPPVLLREREF